MSEIVGNLSETANTLLNMLQIVVGGGQRNTPFWGESQNVLDRNEI